MNIENFKTQLIAYCANNSLESVEVDKWCDIVNNNYHMFKGKDLDGISEILHTLIVNGINEQVVTYTASIIAYNEDAKMNTDKDCSTVFMAYSKRNKK